MLPRSAVDTVNRLRRAHSRERRRVARELHDQVAHSLAVALNSLELHESYLEKDPRRARQQLDNATRSVRRALERVRALSTDLRSREVDDGLERALADYLHMMAPPTVTWAVKMSGDDSALPAELRDELYLILREAARNSLIHSSARHLEVVVDIGADAVHATVSDDGRGFDPPERPSAGGLASMWERAQLLGGCVTLASRPGAGTAVQVHVPLEIAADQQ
jgi:signal transduction histidine kinase